MLSDLRQDYIDNTDVDFSNPSVLERPSYRRRRSSLMITLADPKIAPEDIQKMMELGINIVKFKTSNCTKGERIRLLGKLDKAVDTLCKKHATLDWPITTCIELKTCIVKTGFLEGEDDFVTIKEGHTVILIYDIELFDKCNSHIIFVDNPFIADVKVGMSISLDEDEIVLRCVKVLDEKSIKCLVVKTGKLTNMALVAVRGGAKSARPLITKKDLQIIRFAMEYQIDMIIINYSRQPETIKKVKEFIGSKIKRPILLAGVCTQEGLKNVDAIIKESDGLVFSREFLAYELDETWRYRLLHIQKMVNAKCQLAGKPFFLSGDVFKGTLEHGEFFNNETADITNAILDGASGFILKECKEVDTVLEVIRAMDELCCCIEPLTNSKTGFWRVLEGIKLPANAAEACAVACAGLANQLKARVIVIPTVTGYTAKTLMWLRPASLVITVSTRTETTRRLQSYRGVVPLMFPGGHFDNWYAAVEARVHFAVEHAVKIGWLKLGDHYVTLQRGSEDSVFCDMVRNWQVTIAKKARVECPDEMKKDSRMRSSRRISVFMPTATN